MNMKKFAGAFLAATMLFGAAPVFAADQSPVPGEIVKVPVEGTGIDSLPAGDATTEINGETVTLVKKDLDDKVAAEVDTAEKVFDILDKAGYKPAAGTTVVIAGADYSLEGKKVDSSIVVDFATQFAPNSTVYVMHKGENGWEVIEAKVAADGTVTAKLNGLSPVVIAQIKKMSDGSVVVLEKDATGTKTTTPAKADTTKKSPNTGF